MSEYRVIVGDCLDALKTLEAGSVQTCVTSPPYWGLRDYQTASWEGGDPECGHSPERPQRSERPRKGLTGGLDYVAAQDGGATAQQTCGCGARRVDSQLGLEPTPDEYVQNLVRVFREVRRVLRDDGTVWLNLGDSYCANGRYDEKYEATNPDRAALSNRSYEKHGGTGRKGYRDGTLKPKDLVGIPWRVAFALQADGWWLRSDIIWAKPNPMPESVTDRPTRSHEYLFLLTKSARYFYDADAVREDDGGKPSGNGFVREHRLTYQNADGTARGVEEQWEPGGGRNKRSVWTVATQPYPGQHFAVFPMRLIEPCVLAGSSPQACGVCGAPWERVVEVRIEGERKWCPKDQAGDEARALGASPSNESSRLHSQYFDYQRDTGGWQPTCDHQDGTGTCLVLDPFAGAGTTGLVALRHDRDFIGIELSPEYAQMARDRIYQDGPLLNVEAA